MNNFITICAHVFILLPECSFFTAACGTQVSRQASSGGLIMSLFERKFAIESSATPGPPSGGERRLAEKRHSDSLATRRLQLTGPTNNNGNVAASNGSTQFGSELPTNQMPLLRNQQQSNLASGSTANLHPTLTATIAGKQTSTIGSSALLAARLSVNSLGSHFSANGKAPINSVGSYPN